MATEILVPVISGGAILSLLGGTIWALNRHTSNSKKHACADNLVFDDVCEERGKANDMVHRHLKEGIEQAIARSDEQHVELKADMRTGFDKLETLIKAQ